MFVFLFLFNVKWSGTKNDASYICNFSSRYTTIVMLNIICGSDNHIIYANMTARILVFSNVLLAYTYWRECWARSVMITEQHSMFAMTELMPFTTGITSCESIYSFLSAAHQQDNARSHTASSYNSVLLLEWGTGKPYLRVHVQSSFGHKTSRKCPLIYHQ